MKYYSEPTPEVNMVNTILLLLIMRKTGMGHGVIVLGVDFVILVTHQV